MTKKMTMAILVLSAILFSACGPGPVGPQGAQGEQGEQGSTGPSGAQGPAGADGASIAPVQFCDGTTTYPSSFPEFGLCINQALYAVYWDGSNSWLAKVVDGTYKSTATGLQCTFTVSGCTVSR